MSRTDYCREYHFETLQPDSIKRWPKHNDLLTIEGDRCLMPLSKSILNIVVNSRFFKEFISESRFPESHLFFFF